MIRNMLEHIFKYFIIVLILSTNYIFVNLLDNKVFSFNTVYYITVSTNCYYRRRAERYGLAAKRFSLFCR